jgi:predicted nucleic acid-binding protein
MVRARSTFGRGIALDHSRTVYDSLYLALAESLTCQVVTADDRLFNSMQGTALASHLIHVRDFV